MIVLYYSFTFLIGTGTGIVTNAPQSWHPLSRRAHHSLPGSALPHAPRLPTFCPLPCGQSRGRQCGHCWCVQWGQLRRECACGGNAHAHRGTNTCLHNRRNTASNCTHKLLFLNLLSQFLPFVRSVQTLHHPIDHLAFCCCVCFKACDKCLRLLSNLLGPGVDIAVFGAQKGLMHVVVELLLSAPHDNINWLSTSLHAAELLLVSFKYTWTSFSCNIL